MNNEPVITSVSVGAIVSAVLYLLISFGLPITSEQTEAILQVVALVAPIAIAAFYARSQVTPVRRARKRRKRPNDRRDPNLRA